ncbi:ABC transporter permease [Lacibacterium aquatile]|uniref:ABC transporter permease n=1 Tax=Lacibacterium aquatile TaxID=1168082 RepID=A0ABW5DP99_9PROT
MSVIWLLLVKELHSLWRDRFMLGLVLYSFTAAVYIQAYGISHDLHNAPIGIVDGDRSPLSQAITDSLRAPFFQPPVAITAGEIDQAMDQARLIFVLDIPEGFQADLAAGRAPTIQLLIDATALMQAGLGATYIQSLVADEIARFKTGRLEQGRAAVGLQVRVAFNQSLATAWFTGTMALITNITMLSVLLTGAALQREREHGTLEHVLTMPVQPIEIMLSKVLGTGLVILVLTAISLLGILHWLIGMPLAGSIGLFLAGSVFYLFFTTSLGIFLGTLARSMAQLGLLFILVVLPMNLLSGGMTPLESMPEWLQTATRISPTTQYVAFAQAILYRGASLDVVWGEMAATFGIGLLFFVFSLTRFRAFLAAQQ